MFTDSDLNVEQPDDGVDAARVAGKPAWCAGAPAIGESDTWTPGRIARLFWLATFVRAPRAALPAASAFDNLPLLYYAIAQIDLARLDTAAIDKQLAAPPYNEYARTVANETIGWLRGRQKVYERALDKLAKGDDDYTQILRTAPAAAFARWEKIAAALRPEMERSLAFERLLSKPSRKALRGCAPPLLADAAKVVLALGADGYKDLLDKVAVDPAANLLLGRLAVCLAAEKAPGAGAVRELVKRGVRGPRRLALVGLEQPNAEGALALPGDLVPRDDGALVDFLEFEDVGEIVGGGGVVEGGEKLGGARRVVLLALATHDVRRPALLGTPGDPVGFVPEEARA